MKSTFNDHSFHKILQHYNESTLASRLITLKINELEDINDTLQKDFGEEYTHNILSYKEVKRALEQCYNFINNLDSSLSSTDFFIYYEYLATKFTKIDRDLSTICI